METKPHQNLKLCLLSTFLGALIGAPTFWAIAPNPQSVLLKGDMTPYFQGTLEEMKRTFPEHIMTIAISQYIENSLAQIHRTHALPGIMRHLREYVESYAFDSLS